jgi:hypothetical protein
MDLRTYAAQCLVRFLKSGVRTGFSAASSPHSSLTWFDRDPATAHLGNVIQSEAIFIVTTYLERCNLNNHVAAIEKVVKQTLDPMAVDILNKCHFIVAFQYRPDDLEAANFRCSEIMSRLPEYLRWKVSFALIDLHGKVNALNKCIQALSDLDFKGFLGWVDDDVVLGEDCLAKLKQHLENNPQVIVAGGQKLPVPNIQKAAHIFFKMKSAARETSRPIPHGCALLARFPSIREGIPSRYVGEDGYISMRFFDENRANALEQMAVVQGATCVHTVGGPAGEIFKRVRRTVDLNSILLADFSEQRSVRFAKEVIFHGLLSDPLPEQDQKVSAKNKAMKVLLYWMYFNAGIRFKLRSIFNMPMNSVSWNAYSRYSHPESEI